MAEERKRVEVRLGTFSCTIEGYDDPISKLKEVMELVRRAISEAPILVDISPDVDEAEVRAVLDGAAATAPVAAGGDAETITTPATVVDAQVANMDESPTAAGKDEPERPESGAEPAGDPEAVTPASSDEAAKPATVAETTDRGPASRPIEPELPGGAAPAATDSPAGRRLYGLGRFAAGAAGARRRRPATPQIPGEAEARAADPAPPATGDAAPTSPDTTDAPTDTAASGSDNVKELDEKVASVPQPTTAPAAGDDVTIESPGRAPRSGVALSGAEFRLRRSPPDDGAGETVKEEDDPAHTIRAADSEPKAAPASESSTPQVSAPEVHETSLKSSSAFSRLEQDSRPLIKPSPRERVPLGEQLGAEVTNIFATDAPADEAPSNGGLRRSSGSAERAGRILMGEIRSPDPTEKPPEPPTSRFGSLMDRLKPNTEEEQIYQAQPEEEPEAEPEPITSPIAIGLNAAELAQLVGAMTLGDLLMASAAWLRTSQGKAEFSRQDVMEVFSTIPGDHVDSLEARIKGFGKLLRSGSLVPASDGMFTLGEAEIQRYKDILG